MQMPIMDGYEAARKMRQAGTTVPIVAFTANVMKQDILRCVEAGCTTHLTKPFRKSSLFECLRRQLGEGRATDTPDDPVHVITSKLHGEPEVLPLLRKFVEGLSHRVERLMQAAVSSDFVLMSQEGHALVGSAGIFGYESLARLGSALEGAAQAGNAGACRDIVTTMSEITPALRAGLNADSDSQKSGGLP